MSQHFRITCMDCRAVISQCRCPSKDKEQRLGICSDCQYRRDQTAKCAAQEPPDAGAEGCICPQDGSTCWTCAGKPSEYCKGHVAAQEAEHSKALAHARMIADGEAKRANETLERLRVAEAALLTAASRGRAAGLREAADLDTTLADRVRTFLRPWKQGARPWYELDEAELVAFIQRQGD